MTIFSFAIDGNRPKESQLVRFPYLTRDSDYYVAIKFEYAKDRHEDLTDVVNMQADGWSGEITFSPVGGGADITYTDAGDEFIPSTTFTNGVQVVLGIADTAGAIYLNDEYDVTLTMTQSAKPYIFVLGKLTVIDIGDPEPTDADETAGFLVPPNIHNITLTQGETFFLPLDRFNIFWNVQAGEIIPHDIVVSMGGEIHKGTGSISAEDSTIQFVLGAELTSVLPVGRGSYEINLSMVPETALSSGDAIAAQNFPIIRGTIDVHKPAFQSFVKTNGSEWVLNSG